MARKPHKNGFNHKRHAKHSGEKSPKRPGKRPDDNAKARAPTASGVNKDVTGQSGNTPAEGSQKCEPLREELRPYLIGLSNGGLHLQHPFLSIEVFDLEDCADVHRHFDLHKRIYDDFCDRKDVGGWLSAVCTPAFRLQMLKELSGSLDDETYWRSLGQIWAGTETFGSQWKIMQQLITARRPGKEAMMNETERLSLRSLPEPIEIFRGYSLPRFKMGWSWTTNRSTAQWFAKRFAFRTGHEARVASGTVGKHDVHAHFLERNEFEIVVDPMKVVLSRVYRLKQSH